LKKIPALSSLPVRAASGAVYAGLVTGALLWSEYSAAIVFCFFIILMCHEFLGIFAPTASRTGSIMSRLAALSLPVAGFISAKTAGQWPVMFVPLLLTISLPVIYMITDRKFEPRQALALMVPTLYFGLPLWLAIDMSFTPDAMGYATYSAYPVLYIFVLIWAYDSFAYLTGCTFGKTRLFPSVSPKKSVEGLVGGVVLTLLLSVGASFIFDIISLRDALVLPLLVSIFGTFGDLLASWLKRSAEIKDFGNIMPGHGGMLDRLDSILYILPWVWAYYSLF